MTEASSTPGIDLGRVTDWLCGVLPRLEPPLEFALIAGGRSNLTYRFVDRSGAAWVLRRPPLGHVLESAHDVGREHRIVSALQGSSVPVPPVVGLCADTEVIGAPFYVMGFVEGRVLHDASAAAELPVSDRQRLGGEAVDVLARLHRTDPEAVGLGDLGRKEAYLARQLRRWGKQWEATRTHEIPDMEESACLLSERMPEQAGATIVHGDFRLGNTIVAGGTIRALLDWELCTLGDPLADLGYLLNSWPDPGEPGAESSPSGAGGFRPRSFLIERYAETTGRDVSRIDYYRAFQHWRLAAIGQGVYKRYVVGVMAKDDAFDVEQYRLSVVRQAGAALKLLRRL